MSKNTNDPDDAEELRLGDEVVASFGWHLRRSRLFAGVGEDVVSRYAPAFTLRSIRAGRSLVRAGSAERDVHVIRRGKVRIEHPVAAGRTFVVSVLGAGDVFGLETLVADRVPELSARCEHETLLLSAPAQCLRPALDESARLASNVAESIAQTLAGFALALRGLVHAPCSEGVLRTLEQIARQHGVGVADGTLLDLALTPDDIAALTGSSSETVALAFFFLEREGRIRTDGSLITLLGER